MKIITLRTALLACAVFVSLFVSSNQASAAAFISFNVGGPPPHPRHDYDRWERPYRTAVWIPGHYEWDDGRWVWIGGYYDYPPRRGAEWVPGHYRHGQWRPGHWAY